MHRIQNITNQLQPTLSSNNCSSTSLEQVVIVAASRTPIGAVNGSLKDFTAAQLASFAIKDAIKKANIKPSDIKECIFGNVLSAGQGQAPARQAALLAGLPITTPCTTVNKVCASGMKALMIGAQTIACGTQNCVVVGGMESMSRVPYYIMNTRIGALKLGNDKIIDGIINDGLTDAYNQVHMGTCAEQTAHKLNISRQAQDDYAIQSYQRSQKAHTEGKFKNEIVPIEVNNKGKKLMVTQDDEVFRLPKDPNAIRQLRTSFSPKIKSTKVIGAISPESESSQPSQSTITAANASTLSDGAAAIILMSASRAKELGVKPLAYVAGFGDAATSPVDFAIAPSLAVPVALKNAGIQQSQVDVWELNEAFASVSLANNQLLKLDPSTVNMNGGAISLGHPIGCSGARIIVTLLSVLEQQNKSIGVASLCNGGGGSSAVVIRRA